MSYPIRPIPARAGVGLKAQHFRSILETEKTVDWFEIHPENYFIDGGYNHFYLDKIRHNYPLSMHGIGMSLGSADGLDSEHLSQLKKLIDQYQPSLISEHLSWSRIEGQYSNDLLPLPYTEEALTIFVSNVHQAQESLGRRLLIENPSSYFRLNNPDYTEWEFLISVCKATGAGILLDVNNLYVSAINHGFEIDTYLAALPKEWVGEIHLAGHSVENHDFGDLLIDDHGSQVTDAVWQLYQKAIAMLGSKPTLIEWDTNLPDWEVLSAEAHKADRLLKANRYAKASPC